MNGAEEERKRLEELKKAKPKIILKKSTSLAQERNQMMNFLKGQGYKNLQKLRYPQMKELYDKVQESIKDSFKDFIPMGSEKEKQLLQERDAKRLLRKRKATISEEQPSKKLKLRTETIDELRNYLRIVDFEQNAQDRESLEAISVITEFKVIDSPDGEYLIIFRANNHFRAFNTLWEILHILDRQDLYHLYRVVQDYYEHIPPTGLGLVLLGVHTLELEDGTTIHMLAERRYPLSRELMIRMLDHGMEVEDEKGNRVLTPKRFSQRRSIPFKNSLQTLVKDFENSLLNELNEVKMVFNQMEAAVDQCLVDKKLFEIKKKELKLENERMLQHIICQDVVNIVMHADVKSVNVLHVQNTFLDDNIALDVMKMENYRLIELLVSQDLVHTAVNSLAAINDYKSKKCVFDANHDLCVVNYLFDVNARARAKSVNSIKKKEWKTTSKNFKNVGYKWVIKIVPWPRSSTTNVSTDTLKASLLINIKVTQASTIDSWIHQFRTRAKLNSPTPYAPPSKKDYEILFQPLFDEYFNPPPCNVSLYSVVVDAPRAVDRACSLSSTTIDQDVPSASISPTN
ncbi:hypothetical protein Tco_0535778 [Tanacetum coccineum]